MDEVVSEFLVESYENLDRLDQDLVSLEKDPGERETLARIFRTIHTIKGTCGFLGFTKLESVTHVGESLLSRLRDGEIALNAEIAAGLLAMVDAVREILSGIETMRSEGERDYAYLIDLLSRLQGSAATEPPPAAPSRSPARTSTESPGGLPAPGAATGAQGTGASSGRASEASIRVDVVLLDRLMNLVGELVLTRNQIQKNSAAHADPALLSTALRLSQITTELQEGVMKTRMQPIGNVWSKMPRFVRDLCASCGKKVHLTMEGSETELDRSILEAVRDPLTHLIRNAVDHGIETPEARLAAGKSREGSLVLRAFHEAGQIHIEIADDGAGVDPQAIRREAVQRGLLTEEQASSLGDRESLNLIFVQGFSTARRVTSVSGRGVGMDVVKTNIEKIGGSVEIRSQVGHGTSLRIRLPLTLAIVPVLIASCRGDLYAVPQGGLRELVRLDGAERARIESFHGAEVLRLRDRLIPIARLDGVLGGPPAPPRSSRRREPTALNIVVLQVDGRPFGLVVDEILDNEEIVVKPLGRHLKSLSPFAGATILGDGRVALILDLLGVAQRARVVSESRDRTALEIPAAVEERREEGETLLIFSLDDGGRMALPLPSVARLEEFPRAAVERTGARQVVQYRSGILPLIPLADILGGPRARGEEAETVQVVVYSHDEGRVGLVVERILDIVTEPLKLQHTAGRDGIVGSAVIQNRITEVLDVDAVLRRAGERHVRTGPHRRVR
jgi:two-component system chemotaxis sensor kinase CheA